jgi:hypothetical protein
MSFTGTHHVFVSVDQDGVNDLVEAFFQARPHFLHYGSIPFVSASSVTQTQIAPIPFPMIPGGIAWRVDFKLPQIDLFPADGPLPSPLTLGADQFAVHTTVRLMVGCGTFERSGNDKPGSIHPVATELEIWAVGKLVVHDFGGGNGEIGFEIDEVEIVDIEPQSLEDVLNCVLKMMLQAAISGLWIPFHVLSAGFLKLILEAGPTIKDDQVEVWGTIT